MLQIYLMKTDDFLKEELFLQGCGLVDSTRLQKINACRQIEDKVRSLCCGLLLQYAVKKQLGKTGLQELRYGSGEHGKPYFLDYPQFHFSLSHSGEYAVLAFGDVQMGIDIQKKRPLKAAMAEKVLSAQEYLKYKALERSGEQESYFFRCWCAKESYSKLTGNGLLQELNTIVFDDEKQKIFDVKEERYVYGKEYVIENDYFVNVCAERKTEFPGTVTELKFSHVMY